MDYNLPDEDEGKSKLEIIKKDIRYLLLSCFADERVECITASEDVIKAAELLCNWKEGDGVEMRVELYRKMVDLSRVMVEVIAYKPKDVYSLIND